MVAARGRTPERGDLIWLEFEPTRGHEQRGRRPALVLSPKNYNAKAGLALVVPVTSHAKGYPFEVSITHARVQDVALVDQLRSIDWKARRAEKIGTVSDVVMTHVVQLMQTLIGTAE